MQTEFGLKVSQVIGKCGLQRWYDMYNGNIILTFDEYNNPQVRNRVFELLSNGRFVHKGVGYIWVMFIENNRIVITTLEYATLT